MMAIVRVSGQWQDSWPPDADIRIALVRQTPSIVATEAGQADLFCVGEEVAFERFRERGWNVVTLRDGWYEDDDEGGVAIWGQGAYWEIRDSPFSVREAVGPSGESSREGEGGEAVDVRKGIFGT